MVSPKLPKDDIEKRFPSSKLMKMPSGKDYMRMVPKLEIKKHYKK